MPCDLVAVQVARLPQDIPTTLARAVIQNRELLRRALAALLGVAEHTLTIQSQAQNFVRFGTPRGSVFISVSEIQSQVPDLVRLAEQALRQAGLWLLQSAIVETVAATAGAEVVSDELTARGRVVRIGRM